MKIISSHIPLDAKDVFEIEQHLYKYIDDNSNLPSSINSTIFPDSFTEEKMHLIMPSFFSKAFRVQSSSFVNDVSIAGFFYFKYLLCFDIFADQDLLINNKAISQTVLLQAHIYHEEALKILGKLLGKKRSFWNTWSLRSNELLASVMQDKVYDIRMTYENYEKLCVRKCSFYKAAVDVFFHSFSSAKQTEMKGIYTDLLELIDNFSIGRCIQDDIEDIVKDLRFSKNNLCHIELNKSLTSLGRSFSECNVENIQNFCIGTGTYEKALKLSISYYSKALAICDKYPVELKKLSTLIKTVVNTLNLYLVQFKAYRIDKIIRRHTPLSQPFGKYNVNKGAEAAKRYIKNKQFLDGCWSDVMNKQGLSNVWSTAFISIFNDDLTMLKSAGKFLINKKYKGLWGYNDDWTFDYDSSTCSLIAIVKSDYTDETAEALQLWAKGQNHDGGFSTYSLSNYDFIDRMALPPSKLKGWCQSQVCVSALAYYFLCKYNKEQKIVPELRQYLLAKRTKNGLWPSYWWTSDIYSTYFVIQGMLNDKDITRQYIDESAEQLVRRQRADGSFICNFTKEGSAFYTGLVVDLLCSDSIFREKYSNTVLLGIKWLLANQFQDGSFSNTNFLAIPNPNTSKLNFSRSSIVNNFGGGSSITGEQYACYTTIVAYSAFNKFIKANNN
jgi:squalene-hopene/tetraprenyl-beta-curcumene cyclase